jgi:hypothetical protein
MTVKLVMEIRKISVGPDYKGGAMHYIVGQKVLNDTYEIHLIKLEDFTQSIKIFIINESNEILLWKEFTQTIPISIEYNIFY